MPPKQQRNEDQADSRLPVVSSRPYFSEYFDTRRGLVPVSNYLAVSTSTVRLDIGPPSGLMSVVSFVPRWLPYTLSSRYFSSAGSGGGMIAETQMRPKEALDRMTRSAASECSNANLVERRCARIGPLFPPLPPVEFRVFGSYIPTRSGTACR